jgi:PAS domain S-box-containing protein
MRAPRETPPAPDQPTPSTGGAEARLRQSEERFRNVFDHAPIGILLLGPDVHIQRANRALCAMLGYEEAEMLGRPVTDFLHADEHPESQRLQSGVLAGAVDDIAVERRAVRRDGRIVRLQVRSTVQRDAGGNVDIVISQLVDVTEQRMQEEKLRESEARLRTIRSCESSTRPR